jgi:hypothetical protein
MVRLFQKGMSEEEAIQKARETLAEGYPHLALFYLCVRAGFGVEAHRHRLYPQEHTVKNLYHEGDWIGLRTTWRAVAALALRYVDTPEAERAAFRSREMDRQDAEEARRRPRTGLR